MKSSAKVMAGIRRLNRRGRTKPARLLVDHQHTTWPSLSAEMAMPDWLAWFEQQGYVPFPFQRQAWNAYFSGRSGVIAVATGSGKTYAALGGPLIELMTQPPSAPDRLSILYISPLKALVRDVIQA
ncbi:MAG: DEAD/DEAH box helicase, partial [Nitrospira sp.]